MRWRSSRVNWFVPARRGFLPRADSGCTRYVGRWGNGDAFQLNQLKRLRKAERELQVRVKQEVEV